MSAFGMYVSGNGPRVLNNDVIATVKQGAGVAQGICLEEVTGGLVEDNRITQADIGIIFSSSTGKYRDNLTFNVTIPFLGGTDAGNNS